MAANIRKMNSDDIEAVVDLNGKLFSQDSQWLAGLNMDWPAESGRQYFSSFLHDDKKQCWVAELDNGVCGYLAASIHDAEEYRELKIVELENMYVIEKFQRAGVGRQLVEQFHVWAKEKGGGRLHVSVAHGNTGAVKFYETLGFQPYSIELEMEA